MSYTEADEASEQEFLYYRRRGYDSVEDGLHAGLTRARAEKQVLHDFYSVVRDIAKTADGYDTFEERVIIALAETERNLTSG